MNTFREGGGHFTILSAAGARTPGLKLAFWRLGTGPKDVVKNRGVCGGIADGAHPERGWRSQGMPADRPIASVEASDVTYRCLIQEPLFFLRMALLIQITVLLFFSNEIATIQLRHSDFSRNRGWPKHEFCQMPVNCPVIRKSSSETGSNLTANTTTLRPDGLCVALPRGDRQVGACPA